MDISQLMLKFISNTYVIMHPTFSKKNTVKGQRKNVNYVIKQRKYTSKKSTIKAFEIKTYF